MSLRLTRPGKYAGKYKKYGSGGLLSSMQQDEKPGQCPGFVFLELPAETGLEAVRLLGARDLPHIGRPDRHRLGNLGVEASFQHQGVWLHYRDFPSMQQRHLGNDAEPRPMK